MKLYTIGFTQKSAERFFGLLAEHGVERVVDIRLSPGGQLSGFAKQERPGLVPAAPHRRGLHPSPELAPSAEIRDDYRKDHDWERYVPRFEALMDERGIPDALDRASFERADQLPAVQRANPGALPSPSRGRAAGAGMAGC